MLQQMVECFQKQVSYLSVFFPAHPSPQMPGHVSIGWFVLDSESFQRATQKCQWNVREWDSPPALGLWGEGF